MIPAAQTISTGASQLVIPLILIAVVSAVLAVVQLTGRRHRDDDLDELRHATERRRALERIHRGGGGAA